MRKLALLCGLLVCAALQSSPIAARQGWERPPWIILKIQSFGFGANNTVVIVLASGTTITVPGKDMDAPRMQSLYDSWEKQPASQRAATAAAVVPAEPSIEPVPSPDNAMQAIRYKCQVDWPADYKMQEFCQRQQRAAVNKLFTRNMFNQPEHRAIRRKCQTDWPDDFKMRDFCEEQQLKALAAIR
jgi:hypothetical protein